MKALLLSAKVKKVLTSLERGEWCTPSRGMYVVLDESAYGAGELLEEWGYKKCPFIPDLSGGEAFLSEYVDMMGKLNVACNSRLWWASTVASKNRFTSRVSNYLAELIRVMEVAEREECDHLIVIGASWVVEPAIVEYFRSKGVSCVTVGRGLIKAKEIAIGWIKDVAMSTLQMFRLFVRKLWVDIRLRKSIASRLRNDARYSVLKSFVYAGSFKESGVYRDAFYGSLVDYEAGIGNVLIFGYIANNFRFCVSSIAKCKTHLIIPTEYTVSYKDIICAYVDVLMCSLRIPGMVLFRGCDVSGIFKNELARTRNGVAYNQYLHYHATKGLLKRVSVSSFLMTYENNPWEKMCILAAREHSPATQLIGYQHTVIPQASANMFVGAGECGIAPLPDRILTVGSLPKQIMERYGRYSEGMIEEGCGLRFEYLPNVEEMERTRSGRVLVVLEGIFDVYKMVNYVLRQLGQLQHYKIIIRCHPVLPIKRIKHKLVCNVEDLDAVSISHGKSLKEDVRAADIVVYWGSTVGLEALCMGKPIVHYNNKSLLSYDPLFECADFKWVVSDDVSLADVIEEIYSINDGDYEEMKANAREYLSQYISPVTTDRLSRFSLN